MPAQTARTPEPDSYDQMMYESFSYPQTHPQHLYTVAKLFGLKPPDFHKARVLELGCASGGNLLSLAAGYPDSHFTGLDLSQEQIALANTHKKALGLENIVFTQQDITAFNLKKNKGTFDYIICHGVFSWVPDPVRTKILDLCSACLTPDGLALISYNTLPGWNAVRSLREMMLFHTKRFTKPEEKVVQARLLLEFLLENVPKGREGYRATIEEELGFLRKTNDSYLFHDHLEETNSQFYFNEFASLANEHGLGYVGDSNIVAMFVGNLPPQAVEKLQAVNDVVMQEQYMDFIANRRFRSSILCKNANAANVRRGLQAPQILDFYVSTTMTPETPMPDPKKPVAFKVGDNNQFSANTETAALLYLELAASGLKPIKVTDLIQKVQKKLKLKTPETVEATFIQSALHFAMRGYLQLHSDSPPYITTVSKKPVTFPVARYQASLKNCTGVINALHANVRTDILANVCLQFLDGSRTVQDLTDHVTKQAIAGEINVNKDGKVLTDEKDIRKELAARIDETLVKCGEQALLVG